MRYRLRIAILLAFGLFAAALPAARAQMPVHSVRGLVAQNETGLEGIRVVLSGAVSDTAQTDANGEFMFTDLPNGEYTITPISDQYRFEPEQHTLTLVPGGNAVLPVFNAVAVTVTTLDELPAGFDTATLFPNAPNPFRDRTLIRYRIVTPGEARVEVYDVLGRHLSTLRSGFHEPGLYEVVFAPVQLPPGIYLFRLLTPNEQHTRPMILAQ